LAYEECYKTVPVYREVKPEHFVACHLVDGQGSAKIPAIA
jgi:hypothetical protein